MQLLLAQLDLLDADCAFRNADELRLQADESTHNRAGDVVALSDPNVAEYGRFHVIACVCSGIRAKWQTIIRGSQLRVYTRAFHLEGDAHCERLERVGKGTNATQFLCGKQKHLRGLLPLLERELHRVRTVLLEQLVLALGRDGVAHEVCKHAGGCGHRHLHSVPPDGAGAVGGSCTESVPIPLATGLSRATSRNTDTVVYAVKLGHTAVKRANVAQPNIRELDQYRVLVGPEAGSY